MSSLYHLSPENFHSFDPKKIGTLMSRASVRIGERGIFFTTNLKDCLKWAPVVGNAKGDKSRNQGPLRRRINEEYSNEEREDGIPYPPRDQLQYKFLFMYICELNRNVLQEIKNHNKNWNLKNNSASDEDYRSPIGSWDSEIFVPEEYLGAIKIISKDQYETDFLIGWHSAIRKKEKSNGWKEFIQKEFYGKVIDTEETSKEEYDETIRLRKVFDKNFAIGDQIESEQKQELLKRLEGIRSCYRPRQRIVSIPD